MNKMKTVLSAVFNLMIISVCAQDISYNRRIVDTFTTPTFWGRGYTNDGMSKAADFITTQFQSFGLVPLKGKTYHQNFSYPVNTFPGKMEVSINDIALQPGKDFIVSPESKGVKGIGKLRQVDSTQFIDDVNKVIRKSLKVLLNLHRNFYTYGQCLSRVSSEFTIYIIS